MVQIYNSGSFALPAENFVFFNVAAAPNDTVITSGALPDGSLALMLGLDVVDANLTEGSDAQVVLKDTVSGTQAILMRAFTYASSQGTYTWRGTLLLTPNLQIILAAFSGAFYCTMWGLRIPVPTDSP